MTTTTQTTTPQTTEPMTPEQATAWAIRQDPAALRTMVDAMHREQTGRGIPKGRTDRWVRTQAAIMATDQTEADMQAAMEQDAQDATDAQAR